MDGLRATSLLEEGGWKAPPSIRYGINGAGPVRSVWFQGEFFLWHYYRNCARFDCACAEAVMEVSVHGMEGDSSRLARVVGIAHETSSQSGAVPAKNVMGKTLDLGDTVLMGTATRFTRPLIRVRGQDFQRAGGSPRARERLLMEKPAGRSARRVSLLCSLSEGYKSWKILCNRFAAHINRRFSIRARTDHHPFVCLRQPWCRTRYAATAVLDTLQTQRDHPCRGHWCRQGRG